MSEDESDDDLPSISFSSLSQTIKEEAMPSASEVAAQRERQRRTAAELQALREGAAGRRGSTSNSSSEGDSALAAHAARLQLLPEDAPPPPPRSRRPCSLPAARRLLTLLPPAVTAATAQLAAALDKDDNPAACRVLSANIAHGLTAAWACPENSFTEDETVYSAAVLAACVWAGGGLGAARALRRVLAGAARGAAGALGAAAARAAGGGAGAATALLRLADVLRAVPAASPASMLAAALVHRGLLVLLRPNDDLPDELCMQPSQQSLELLLSSATTTPLDGRTRRLCLQLAARGALLAGAGGGAGGGDVTRGLLHTLAHPPRHKDKLHPEFVQLAAVSSTLRLMFGAEPRAATVAALTH